MPVITESGWVGKKGASNVRAPAPLAPSSADRSLAHGIAKAAKRISARPRGGCGRGLLDSRTVVLGCAGVRVLQTREWDVLCHQAGHVP